MSLEARTAAFEKAMNRANNVTNNTARRIEQRFNRMSSVADNAFGKVAAVYASAQTLRGAASLIDANTRIENSLKVAGLAGEDLTRVYDSLYASAQRNAAPIESLVTLYGRAAIVQKELGVSTEQLLGFTDNVALALRVAGTDAQTASGALLQLSQALGSGVVRAEEFNSILEGALPIAQAAANGLEEAGGSVAKLRGLVVDGKVSSEAFFRAFEVGSAMLRDKVAGSELTISQAFIRLQNVLIDVAGKFNEGTGAGRDFIDFLGLLSERISLAGDNFEKGITPVQRFLRAIMDVSREAGKTVGANNIGIAIRESFEGARSSVSATEVALTDAEQALVNFAENSKGKFGELDPVVQDLIQQLLEGRGTAESAAEAIVAIDGAGDFGNLTASLGGLVETLFGVRDAAIAARNAAAFGDIGSFPSSQEFSSTFGAAPSTEPAKPVSIANYPVGAGSGGKGGGGKKSGADRFADELKKQQDRIDALNRETQLQATLNPLVDDYGFAIERIRAQIELENAAKEAGLPLDQQRGQKIDELATGYAQATAEAAKLAEAQDKARQTADDLAAAGQRALDSIIDGFLEGRDAGEILNNTLQELGKSILKIGLDGLFSGIGGGGGGGLFGGIFSALFGGKRETGGSVQSGKAYVVGEKRPELFVPGRSGTIIPKIPDIAGMSARQSGAGGGQIMVSGEFQVVNGNLVPVVTQISGQVAGQQVKAYDRQLPNRLQDINMRQN